MPSSLTLSHFAQMPDRKGMAIRMTSSGGLKLEKIEPQNWRGKAVAHSPKMQDKFANAYLSFAQSLDAKVLDLLKNPQGPSAESKSSDSAGAVRNTSEHSQTKALINQVLGHEMKVASGVKVWKVLRPEQALQIERALEWASFLKAACKGLTGDQAMALVIHTLKTLGNGALSKSPGADLVIAHRKSAARPADTQLPIGVQLLAKGQAMTKGELVINRSYEAEHPLSQVASPEKKHGTSRLSTTTQPSPSLTSTAASPREYPPVAGAEQEPSTLQRMGSDAPRNMRHHISALVRTPIPSEKMAKLPPKKVTLHSISAKATPDNKHTASPPSAPPSQRATTVATDGLTEGDSVNFRTPERAFTAHRASDSEESDSTPVNADMPDLVPVMDPAMPADSKASGANRSWPRIDHELREAFTDYLEDALATIRPLWSKATASQRLQFLQPAIEFHASLYGYPALRVELDSAGHPSRNSGQADSGSPADLSLSAEDLSRARPERLLRSILAEGIRHYQMDLVESLNAGDITEDDDQHELSSRLSRDFDAQATMDSSGGRLAPMPEWDAHRDFHLEPLAQRSSPTPPRATH